MTSSASVSDTQVIGPIENFLESYAHVVREPMDSKLKQTRNFPWKLPHKFWLRQCILSTAFSELEPPELRWDLLLAAVGLTEADKADWDKKTDAARVFLTARLATMVYDLQVNMLAAGLTVPIIPPIMPPIVSPMQIVARFETSEERNEVIAITTAALAKIKTELAQVEEAYRDWLAASRAEQEVPLL